MRVTDYVLPLGWDTRKRHRHETERGEVTGFVIQLEVKFHEKWVAIIRYDCAHNVAHMDYYNLKGEKRTEMLNLPFAEVLTLADEDIKENWKDYREKFLQGGWI